MKRLVQAIGTVLAIATILFFLLNLLPGDAALLAGDPRRAQNPEAIAAMRARWGLDQPLHIRYFIYMSNLIRGDLGISYRTSIPVYRLIAQSLGSTLRLVLLAFFLAASIGIVLGFLAAINRGTIIDFISMVFAILGISAPGFWIGLMLMYLFAVNLGILPASGYGDGKLAFMILPAVTLSLPLIALLARTTRAAVLDIIQEDYIRTARAKGLSEKWIWIKHMLRNCFISIITIAGLQLGTLIANTVIIERVFSWPGLGNLIVESILRQDIPAVQGVVLIFALSFIIINLIIDLLYAYLDPRISYS